MAEGLHPSALNSWKSSGSYRVSCAVELVGVFTWSTAAYKNYQLLTDPLHAMPDSELN